MIGEIVRDDNGAILAMRGTTQDITAHKEAEAALQRSEERYAMAAEFGRSAAWEIFPEQGKIYSDKNLAALMGSPDNLPPSELDALMDTIHEDDRDHVVQAMLDVFEAAPSTLRSSIVRP